MRNNFSQWMISCGYDGLVLENPSNYFWLTGFSGDECFATVAAGRIKLIVDSRFTEQAKEQVAASSHDGFEIEIYEYKTPEDRDLAIRDFFVEHKCHVVGFEGDYVNVKRFKKLNEILCGDGASGTGLSSNGLNGKITSDNVCIKLLDIGELFVKPREIKDDNEIEKIKQAALIVDRVCEQLPGILRSGMTELEVAAEIDYRMRKLGADKASFDTIAAAGPNGALAHHEPSQKKLMKGETLVMDFGAYYQGYASDITRTVFIGEPTEQMLKVYDIVLEAQLKAIDGIKAGLDLREADGLARDIISANGYGAYFGHSLGHGIGVDIHEGPRVSPLATGILKESQVVTVEPGIYLPQIGGVRIEDDVIVKKDGCELLTHARKDHIIIDA